MRGGPDFPPDFSTLDSGQDTRHFKQLGGRRRLTEEAEMVWAGGMRRWWRHVKDAFCEVSAALVGVVAAFVVVGGVVFGVVVAVARAIR